MGFTTPTLEFNAQLLQKYNQPLPRYTSYPPATELQETFDPKDFLTSLAVSNHRRTPLSLYCHIPFCDTACYFCGCNTVITQRQEVAEAYLSYLLRHIQHLSRHVHPDRGVQQMHWGGGTPNYLRIDQIETLWSMLHQCFRFEPDAEVSIEVNPKSLNRHYLKVLRDLGFNRISFGIQDFEPQVQAAVNRLQPESMLFDVMAWCREAGFARVNVDLIYGLPFQTLESFRTTIQKTINLDPDRIAIFNFAYVPWMKPIQ